MKVYMRKQNGKVQDPEREQTFLLPLEERLTDLCLLAIFHLNMDAGKNTIRKANHPHLVLEKYYEGFLWLPLY